MRELENIIERATVLARTKEITLADLPPTFADRRCGSEDDLSSLLHMTYAQAKRRTLMAFDRRYLHGVMRKAQGNITAAANLAGLDRSNFRRLLKQYSLAPTRPTTGEHDFEGAAEARGKVSRAAKLRYAGFDAHGQPIDRTVDRFHARVVQHEVDHLDGILYPMRMKDMSNPGFTEVLFPELAGTDDD